MALDDVIKEMGEFGRYQKKIFLILCLPALSCGIHKLSGFFLAAEPAFRCLLSYETPENATYELPESIRNASYPWHHNTQSWSRCERYDINFTDQFHDSNGNLTDPLIEKCNSFVYDKSEYTSTATTEWNLVCDNAWMRTTSNAIFMVGDTIGAMVFCELSDKYGRKPTFIAVLFIQLFSGIFVSVSPEFYLYVIFRSILGATSTGIFLIIHIIALEMVGPNERLAMGVTTQILIPLGSMLTAGITYFITNWRMMQIAFCVPSCAFVVYKWIVPESTGWLLSKGRIEEAKKILKKAALENGVELSEDVLAGLSVSNNEPDSSVKHTSLDLIKYLNLRQKSLILLFVRIVSSGTYYGLSWNSSNFMINDRLIYGVNMAVEIPAFLFIYFTSDKWGRKPIVCGCMLLAGISLLLTLALPTTDMSWLILVLAITGKFAVTSAFGSLYIFTIEQYPIGMRNVGLRTFSTSAKIGGILAPYISFIAEIWMNLPLALFGSFALLAGLSSLLLPETLNKELPESTQDGEQFEK